MRFYNSLSPNNIITSHNNITSCKANCSDNLLCSGLYVYENICNELYNIDGYEYTNLNSSSYTKIVHYEGNYNHSVEGIALSTRDFRNSTIFLDLNYNGILDYGEPNMSTNLFFYFDNLKPGNYLLREQYNDGCYGLLPDVYGVEDSFINTNNQKQNYVNIINKYRGYNHHIIGGNMSNNEIILGNLDYLIDYDNETYISFYPNDTLIVSFSNSTIINDINEDIVFVINKTESDIQARVGVSTLNYRDLTFLGILNETNYTFDLGSVNYEYPVNHIHLEFYSNENNTNNSLNIASIIGNHMTDFILYNSFYIQIPTTEQYAFIRECDYVYPCEDFCDYNSYDWDDFISCNTGCLLADIDLKCDCENLDYRNSDILYSNPLYPNRVLGNFSTHECYRGCEYQVSQFVFPNFTHEEKGIGFNMNIIDSGFSCNNRSCLEDIMEGCYQMNCLSFSLGDLSLFYNSTYYYYHNDSNLFVFNPTYQDRYNNLEKYNTYSPTTSLPTVLPTTSPSFSPTTSLPTVLPTTSLPTFMPSTSPTVSMPTTTPSFLPTTTMPTLQPSSSSPTFMPTTNSPTTMPTTMPTTTSPTTMPSTSPSIYSILLTTNNTNNNERDNEFVNMYLLYGIIGLILLILLIFIISYISKKMRLKRMRKDIENSNLRPSFSNPVYSPIPGVTRNSLTLHQNIIRSNTQIESHL